MNRQQDHSTKVLSNYRAYLVRLWQDSPHTAWRASAQSVQSGETVRFADMEQLFAFLRAAPLTPPLPNGRPTTEAEQETPAE